MNQCNWKSYGFNIYQASSTNWNDVGGIYVFAAPVPGSSNWQALYIGKASSFKDRLPCHERWDEAYRRGVRHIHAMTVRQEAERDRIEKELIGHFQPSMNEQHKNSLWELAKLGGAADGMGLLGLLTPSTPAPQAVGLAAMLGIQIPK